MYAKLHWTNWRKKIVDFSEKIQDVCKSTKKVQSGKNKNKSYFIVDQHMKSLKEYNLPLYKKYYAHELSILKPAKKWKIYPSNVSSFNSLQNKKVLSF